MTFFKNILYLSEPAVEQAQALTKAISLAKRHQAKMTVLEVIPQLIDKINPIPEGLDLLALERELAAERQATLGDLLDTVSASESINIEVKFGKTFIEAIREVLKHHYDLLIKPAENPPWLTRLFGSDDMHLLRKCPCPLWLIKPGEAVHYRNVMAAVDFDASEPTATVTELNQRILRLSTDIALAASIPLQIVHCWQPPDEMLYKAWGQLSEQQARQVIQEEKAAHQHGLRTIADFLREQVTKPVYDSRFAHFHLFEGPPNTSIPETTRRLDADLLVMGTVARAGISGLFIGNTAEAVFEQVNCSVLVVKPSGFVSPVSLSQ